MMSASESDFGTRKSARRHSFSAAAPAISKFSRTPAIMLARSSSVVR